MGQPGYPAPRPPKPPISGGDLAISITALVVTALIGAVAAVFGLFSLAFLDYCPPESCSADGAATAVATALFVLAFVIGLAGLVVNDRAAGPAQAGMAVRGCDPCVVHYRGLLRRRRLRDGRQLKIHAASTVEIPRRRV